MAHFQTSHDRVPQLYGQVEARKQTAQVTSIFDENKFVDSELAACLNPFLPTFCNSI
jgi:hypothetical protein